MDGFSDKLTIGVQTTGLGLLVVFAALALLIVIIMLLGKIMNIKRKGKAAVKKPTKQAPAVAAPSAAVSAAPPHREDELIAALTAAISACLTGERTGGGLVVRSYRRVGAGSAWAKAGRSAQIYNKF